MVNDENKNENLRQDVDILLLFVLLVEGNIYKSCGLYRYRRELLDYRIVDRSVVTRIKTYLQISISTRFENNAYFVVFSHQKNTVIRDYITK